MMQVTRINELKKIYTTIDNGEAMEKYENLPIFPKIIEVELTNHCNYQCKMCPTGLSICSRPRGYMTEAVFNNILEEVSMYEPKSALKFVGQGEPLLHPDALLYLASAKKAGLVVHLTTNGSLLTEEIMEELINIGVDSVKFSFQGVNKEGYQQFRNNDGYDDIVDKIYMLSKKRGDKLKPFLTIGTSVTDETSLQVEQFKNSFYDIVDNVEVGMTYLKHLDLDSIKDDRTRIFLADILKQQESHYRRYKCCPQIFDSLSVRWNGDISSCCSDTEGKMTIGNILQNSIKTSWDSDKQNCYRYILSKCDYEKINHCKTCFDVYGWTYGEN